MASDYYWLAAFVPTVIKHFLRLLDFIKVGSTFYNVLFVTEVLSIVVFLVLVGATIGREISKEKKIVLEEFRKEQILELRSMQSEFFKQYDPLKTQISRMETKLQRAQVTIEYLKRLLADEKARKGQSAEQVNQRAIESIS